MLQKKKILGLMISIFVFVLVSSCGRVMNSPKEVPYLVSAEEIKVWPQPYMQGAMDQLFKGAIAAESGVKIYTIKYRTYFEKQIITASGTIALPDVPGMYPLVTNLHSTVYDNEDSPSGNLEDPLETKSMIDNLPSTVGWITAMPDYIGFGESDEFLHPYVIKEPTVQAIDDFLKACVQFIDDLEGYELDGRLALMGYSQGGWASLVYHAAFDSLQKFSTAPDWNLQFNSAGGPPTDLFTMQNVILAQPMFAMPFYLAYVASAYDEYELKSPVVDIMVKEPYSDTLPQIFDANITTNIYYFPFVHAEWLTESYLTSHADEDGEFKYLIAELKENSVEPFPITAPITIFHAVNDDAVPFSTSQQFTYEMLSMGFPVQLVDISVPEEPGHVVHRDAAPLWLGGTIQMLKIFNP